MKLKVYFLEGFIAFVEGEASRLALGEMLVDKSKITKAEQEEATSFAHESGLKIGEALMKMGKISPHELNSVLQSQIKEKLVEGFRCKSGFYTFKNSGNFNMEAMYRVHPMQVVYEGINRFVTKDEILQNSFYDENSFIVPSPGIKEELRNLVFRSTRELKLGDLITGRLSLKEIICMSPIDASDTLRFLYFLSLAELVEIGVKDFIFRDKTAPKEDITPTLNKAELLTEQEMQKLREQVSFREQLKRH